MHRAAKNAVEIIKKKQEEKERKGRKKEKEEAEKGKGRGKIRPTHRGSRGNNFANLCVTYNLLAIRDIRVQANNGNTTNYITNAVDRNDVSIANVVTVVRVSLVGVSLGNEQPIPRVYACVSNLYYFAVSAKGEKFIAFDKFHLQLLLLSSLLIAML